MKSPIQMFFVILGLAALIGLIPFTYVSYIHTKKAIENKPADY